MPTMRYPVGSFLIIGIFPVQAVGQGIEDLFAELALCDPATGLDEPV